MNATPWPDIFKKILCNLYRYWGRPCLELGETPTEWVAAITGVYASEGVPQFPDQGAVDQFLSELDDLEACLDSPGNTLSEADNLSLDLMIASLRNELGAA